MTSTATRVTPEDLLAMPDGHRYELVDGELVERHMSAETSGIAYELNGVVRDYLKESRSGFGFQADCGLQIFEWRPSLVRFADGGVISRTGLPGGPGDGHLRVAPELLLEVVSPGDIAGEVEEKVREYLRAGVLLVWVVYPVTRTVHVYRADGSAAVLGADDDLDGETVLPGFRCPISALFPAPKPETAPA